jgi:hypothetical protein
MKKWIYILMTAFLLISCGKDSDPDNNIVNPETPLHRLTLENRSDRNCVRLTLYGAEDYVRCQTTSDLGLFEERTWNYIAWIQSTQFENVYNEVGRGSIFFGQEMNCRIYNDRVRWN